MKYLIPLFLLITILPAFGQETKNPSLISDTISINGLEFNHVSREATIIPLNLIHQNSWQVTIDNNLIYANPNGNAVLRLYDDQIKDKFIEIGMGSKPDDKFWVAVQLPEEGYVVVHRNLERGWIPTTRITASYTENAGLTINNGERIVVTNLDVGSFAISSYSVYGLENSVDPPAINSGEMILDFLSGDPSQNIYHLFPFYVTAGVGIIVAILFLTKKRSS